MPIYQLELNDLADGSAPLILQSPQGLRCFVDCGIHGTPLHFLASEEGWKRAKARVGPARFKVLDEAPGLVATSASDHQSPSGPKVAIKLHDELPWFTGLVVPSLWRTRDDFDIALTISFLRLLSKAHRGRLDLGPGTLSFHSKRGAKFKLSPAPPTPAPTPLEGPDVNELIVSAASQEPIVLSRGTRAPKRLRRQDAILVGSLLATPLRPPPDENPLPELTKGCSAEETKEVLSLRQGFIDSIKSTYSHRLVDELPAGVPQSRAHLGVPDFSIEFIDRKSVV